MKLGGMRTQIPAVFSVLFSLKVKEKYNNNLSRTFLLSFQAITFDTSDTSVTNYSCTRHC